MKSGERRDFPRTNTAHSIAAAGPRRTSLTHAYAARESASRRIFASGPRSLSKQMEDAENPGMGIDLSAPQEFLLGLFMTPFIIQKAIADTCVSYMRGFTAETIKQDTEE